MDDKPYESNNGDIISPYNEKDRSPYDGLRPYSAVTHLIGALLSLAGLVVLVVRAACAGTVWHMVSFSIYGASMLALYTASTLYHSLNTSIGTRILLRKLDHSMIYFLIAGTYTPLCLIPLHGAMGWTLFGIIWAMAVSGIISKFLWMKAPRWLNSALYIVMGWMALIAVYPLFRAFSTQGLFWLFSGGIFYTLGGIMYGARWPLRDNRLFGCHEVFHVMCLMGSISHYIMMFYMF